MILNLTPKAKATKVKINKWDYIKSKSFCTVKEAIHKMKRQPTEWEKVTTNYICDKKLTFKIYKEFTQLNSKKKKKKVIQLQLGRTEKTLFQRRHTDRWSTIP